VGWWSYAQLRVSSGPQPGTPQEVSFNRRMLSLPLRDFYSTCWGGQRWAYTCLEIIWRCKWWSNPCLGRWSRTVNRTMAVERLMAVETENPAWSSGARAGLRSSRMGSPRGSKTPRYGGGGDTWGSKTPGIPASYCPPVTVGARSNQRLVEDGTNSYDAPTPEERNMSAPHYRLRLERSQLQVRGY